MLGGWRFRFEFVDWEIESVAPQIIDHCPSDSDQKDNNPSRIFDFNLVLLEFSQADAEDNHQGNGGRINRGPFFDRCAPLLVRRKSESSDRSPYRVEAENDREYPGETN